MEAMANESTAIIYRLNIGVFHRKPWNLQKEVDFNKKWTITILDR